MPREGKCSVSSLPWKQRWLKLLLQWILSRQPLFVTKSLNFRVTLREEAKRISWVTLKRLLERARSLGAASESSLIYLVIGHWSGELVFSCQSGAYLRKWGSCFAIIDSDMKGMPWLILCLLILLPPLKRIGKKKILNKLKRALRQKKVHRR